MNKPKAPCFNCTNRKIGCHDMCKLYLTYHYNLAEYNAEIRHQKELDNDYISYKSRKYRNKER